MSNNRHSLLVQMSTIRELADQPANAIGNLKKIFDMAKSAAARLANATSSTVQSVNPGWPTTGANTKTRPSTSLPTFSTWLTTSAR